MIHCWENKQQKIESINKSNMETTRTEGPFQCKLGNVKHFGVSGYGGRRPLAPKCANIQKYIFRAEDLYFGSTNLHNFCKHKIFWSNSCRLNNTLEHTREFYHQQRDFIEILFPSIWHQLLVRPVRIDLYEALISFMYVSSQVYKFQCCTEHRSVRWRLSIFLCVHAM